MNKKIVIIGAGGHAKVIADIIKKSGDSIYGFLDDNISIGTIVLKRENIKVIGKIEDSKKINSTNNDIKFIIGIGNNEIRKKIVNSWDLDYYTAIHPSSQIGIDVVIEEGTVVMANACINSSTRVGKHCIINTGAIVEHDNVLENYVHVSPNATLCGTVEVGLLSHIGAGAVVRNNIQICNNCIIGCGGTVVKNIREPGVYIGNPVKKVN